MSYSEEVKELVKLRLSTAPANLKVSIGSFGEFSRDQLIEEVENETAIGEAAVEIELTFIRKMATISKRISEAR